MIPYSNAISNPGAVVVKLQYTVIAPAAVLRERRSVHITSVAILPIRPSKTSPTGKHFLVHWKHNLST
jgi:hypothetical protein